MKILLCPDIHFGAHENDENFIDYQFRAIRWVYETASNNGVKDIIFLGDVFDKRRNVNLKILNRVYEEFLREGFNHYFIIGNHDVFYKNNNSVNSLEILFKNHEVISELPVEYTFGSKKLLLTPWINKENIDMCSKVIQESKSDYLLGHLDLSGFELTRGFLSEHSSIDLNLLDKFDHVYSGHYHCYSTKNNITYLGSLCDLNWSDVSEQKYVGILDTETEKFDLIKNPEKYYYLKRIKSLDDVDENIEVYRNKKVKIHLYVDRKIKVEKYISSIVDIASSVNVIDEQILNDSENIDIDSSNVTILDLWKNYLDELEISDRDKKIITNIFSSTYTQVSNGNLDEI